MTAPGATRSIVSLNCEKLARASRFVVAPTPMTCRQMAGIDRFDVLQMGKDTPVVTGSISDSLMALDRKTQQFHTFRVPYPLGFYTRWLDGRIDDARQGWKGRAYWATYSMIPVWHQEGGDQGRGSQLVKFQLRPDPLAQ